MHKTKTMSKTHQENLESKLKVIKLIFYMVLFVWLILIATIVVRFFIDEPITSLFIGTIPLIAVLLILSQLRTKFKKEIERLEEE